MAVTVTFGGVAYTIPSPGESNEWGSALNAYLQALSAAQPPGPLVATGTAARAPLRFTTQTQPTGLNVLGDMYVDAAGDAWIVAVAGTPGTWVKLATTASLSGILTATGTAARAPLRFTTQAEPTGPSVVGDTYIDASGSMWINTVAGSPGTWTKLSPAMWDSVEPATCNTTTNTNVTLFSWTMAEGELTRVEAEITGRDDTPVANVFDFITTCRIATFYRRVGGGATMAGQTSVGGTASSSFATDASASGNTAIIRVSGDVGVPAHWRANIRRLTTLV